MDLERSNESTDAQSLIAEIQRDAGKRIALGNAALQGARRVVNPAIRTGLEPVAGGVFLVAEGRHLYRVPPVFGLRPELVSGK